MACRVRWWSNDLPFIETRAALASAHRAPWRGAKLLTEHVVDPTVCVVSIKQSHELLRGVPSIYVECEKTAILATYGTRRSLELHVVLLPDCTVASYEIAGCLDMWIAAVEIEEVTAGGPCLVMDR
jgi:hypothetical protein